MYNLKYHTAYRKRWLFTGVASYNRFNGKLQKTSHLVFITNSSARPMDLFKAKGYAEPKKTTACEFSESPLNGTTETVLSDKPANTHHQVVMGLPIPWLHQRKEDPETSGLPTFISVYYSRHFTHIQILGQILKENNPYSPTITRRPISTTLQTG